MGQWVSLADKENALVLTKYSGRKNLLPSSFDIIDHNLTRGRKRYCDLKEVHSDSFKIKPKKVQFSKDGDLCTVIYF